MKEVNERPEDGIGEDGNNGRDIVMAENSNNVS